MKMIILASVAAGALALGLSGVAFADPGNGGGATVNCGPPGAGISSVTPNPNDFYGTSPGHVVSTVCAPG